MYPVNDLVAQAHYEQLLREAKQERLARLANRERKGSTLLAVVGRQMVKLGEQLQGENQQLERRLQPDC